MIDSFNRVHDYLRISLTERCNLRCSYCMPEEGLDLTKEEDLLKLEDFDRLIRIFGNMGIKKVRLTGGEPTVSKDCLEMIRLIRKNKSIEKIAITTNGLVFKNKIEAFKEAGLTDVNISLDTLIEAKFVFISKRQGLHRVIDAINSSEKAFGKVKVNCVVIKGMNDDEILDIIELIKDKNIEVRFIEYMPFTANSKY